MAITTVTTTAAEDARLVVAFGAYLGLPINATAAQIKGAVATFMIGVVDDFEQRAAKASAGTGIVKIAPT